jgi:hypothetical protein
MLEPFENFRARRALQFAAAQKSNMLTLKWIEAHSGFWAMKLPGGGFVDGSIDGCTVISLMVTQLTQT